MISVFIAPVTLGRTKLHGDLRLDFAHAHHLAVQGQTRSGKSVMTYNALAQLAQFPHVTLAGCDPSGVLLNPWRGAPHPEWRAMTEEALPQFGEALEHLLAEMRRRIHALLDSWRDKLEGRDFSPEMPLIVVLMEEYPGILKAAQEYDNLNGLRKSDALAPFISMAVGRLVRESAKVGFRVMLLAQRFSSAVVDTDIRSQLGVRVSLRLDNSDAVKMLHEHAPMEVLEQFPLFRPGEGVAQLPGHPLMVMKADIIDYPEYCRRVLSYYPIEEMPR